MDSLNRKITKAFVLANSIADDIDMGLMSLEDDEAGLVYAHADGLRAKRLYAIRDGKCSIGDLLDSDLVKEERKLDREIRVMRKLKEGN